MESSDHEELVQAHESTDEPASLVVSRAFYRRTWQQCSRGVYSITTRTYRKTDGGARRIIYPIPPLGVRSDIFCPSRAHMIRSSDSISRRKEK